MLIGRSKELEAVKEFIRKRHSTLIYGEKGIGKTALLKQIEKDHKACHLESCSPRSILEALIETYNINLGASIRGLTVNEIIGKMKKTLHKRKLILLIDDFDAVNKQSSKVLEKLEDEDVIVIGAGEKDRHRFIKFREKLELKGLERESSKMLVEAWLEFKIRRVGIELIVTKSLGHPGKIREICKDYLNEYKQLRIATEKELFSFFKEVRPKIPERMDVLPLWGLFVIGFLLLGIKVFLYDNGDWHDAYILAGFGYVSLALWKIVQETRKRNA